MVGRSRHARHALGHRGPHARRGAARPCSATATLPFVLALVAMTTIVGVGLNILVGLSGQVSIGHVGFYAIGAYVVGVLTLKGVSFWLALPAAGIVAGFVGALLAVPAIRVSGPYLAMMTIAFAFIVEHGTIEWRELTGGQNGLMGIVQPSFGASSALEASAGLPPCAVVLAGLSLYLFHRLARGPWGKAMLAVRDSETAARAIGFDPVIVKTVAFALSALFTGLAGGLFAVADDVRGAELVPILAVDPVPACGHRRRRRLDARPRGRCDRHRRAARADLQPRRVSPADLRRAAAGRAVAGARRRARHAGAPAAAKRSPRTVDAPISTSPPSWADASIRPLRVEGLTIAFGGIRAATDVALTAEPGRVTALIGPNGAGKTTVLNMIGGFYRPDAG